MVILLLDLISDLGSQFWIIGMGGVGFVGLWNDLSEKTTSMLMRQRNES